MSLIRLDDIRVRVSLLIVAGVLSLVAVFCWAMFWPASYGNIRPYREEDRTALKNMLEQDWYWLVSQDATDFSMDYLLDHQAATFHYPDNSLTVMVYEDDHKPAGFVTYHLLDGYTGRIQFLVVAREYRKKGYGKLLLEYALQDFKKRGICFVKLAVRDNNFSAQKLYEQLGFQVTDSSKGFLFLTKELCSSQAFAQEGY